MNVQADGAIKMYRTLLNGDECKKNEVFLHRFMLTPCLFRLTATDPTADCTQMSPCGKQTNRPIGTVGRVVDR